METYTNGGVDTMKLKTQWRRNNGDRKEMEVWRGDGGILRWSRHTANEFIMGEIMGFYPLGNMYELK